MYEHFWFERYQPKAGNVILDIGAGRGEDIIAFTEAVKPGGRVIAAEAHPEAYRDLFAVCDRYGAECVRVACVGTSGIYQIETTPNYESAYILQGPPTTTSHKVVGQTLTEFISGFGVQRVDLLKMNIEGSELEALTGSPDALPMIRHAVICCHDHRANRGEGERFRTMAPVTRLLEASGFETWTRQDWGHVHAWRKP